MAIEFFQPPLLKRFLKEEVSAHVKSVLVGAIAEARNNPAIETRTFDFNTFAVTINFRSETVVLADDLNVKNSGAATIPLREFERAISNASA
jgi:hypothetical protein